MYDIKQFQKSKTLKIILYIIALAPLLGIYGISAPFSKAVYEIWQVLSLILLGAMLVSGKSYYVKKDGFMGSLLLLEFLFVLMTIIYRGLSFGIFFDAAVIILLTILIQRDTEIIIHSLSLIMVVTSVVSFVMMLMNSAFQNGNYFIGGKNQLSIFLMTAIFIVLLDAKNQKKKISFRYIIFTAICIISVILGGSGSGIVIAIATIFSLIVFKFIKHKKIVFISILALNLLTLCANSALAGTGFWINLTTMLNKSPSLTGRTTIWLLAMSKIKEHMIFGNGKGVEFHLLTNWNNNYAVFEAHNMILEIVLSIGVVGLAVYAQYFYCAVKKLNLIDAKQRLIFLSIAILLLNGLTESVSNSILFSILIAISYCYSRCGENNNGK